MLENKCVYILSTQPDVTVVHREHSQGRMVSWTGPGFARVKDGAGLVFTFENIPYAMEYDIMIRYEPEVGAHILLYMLIMTFENNLCVCVVCVCSLQRTGRL